MCPSASAWVLWLTSHLPDAGLPSSPTPGIVAPGLSFAVLRTVPRKYETGEICEICETSQRIVSTTYVFSIVWKMLSENESYLRSQNFSLSSQNLPKIQDLCAAFVLPGNFYLWLFAICRY